MTKKFMVFIDDDYVPSVYLEYVGLHSDIVVPPNTNCNAGGGKWDFDNETNTLKLYGESYDFGKYDKQCVEDAVRLMNVYRYGERLDVISKCEML